MGEQTEARRPPTPAEYMAELERISPPDPRFGKAVYIYGLTDPRTDEVRYIGKSIRPALRYQNHLNERSNCHRCHWLTELRREGLLPGFMIFERIEGEWPWQEAERYLIAKARSLGWRLTNNTSGGDGVPDLPPEARARIAAVWKGRKHRPESIAKLKAARALRPNHSAATRAKMSASQRGREIKWGDKLSVALRKFTPERVAEVKARLDAGEGTVALAREYQTHRTTISKIKVGTYFESKRKRRAP